MKNLTVQKWPVLIIKTNNDLSVRITQTNTSLSDRIDTTNDGLTQLTDVVSGKAPSNHTHTWSVITGKPSTYAPSTHSHDDRYFTETEINTKIAALNGNIAKLNSQLDSGRIRFEWLDNKTQIAVYVDGTLLGSMSLQSL